jgi:hypothetical protein
MERVAGIEDRLGRVEHEVYPNSAESLRDAVDWGKHTAAPAVSQRRRIQGTGPAAGRSAGAVVGRRVGPVISQKTLGNLLCLPCWAQMPRWTPRASGASSC